MIRNVFLWIAAAAVGATLWGCGGGDSSSTTAASNDGGATTGNGNGASSASGKNGTTNKAEGSSGKTGGSSQAKTEFVDQANAICTEGKKRGLGEMRAYIQAHAPSSGSTQAKVALLGEALQAAFLPEVQKQVDEIRALGAPQGDEQQVEAFLGALEEGVEASGKTSASSGLQLGPNFKRSAQLAREYGLDACVYG